MQADPQNIRLTFNGRTLDYIVNTLAQRPYAEAAPIIEDIRQQVVAHNFGRSNSEGPAIAGAVGPWNDSGVPEGTPAGV